MKHAKAVVKGLGRSLAVVGGVLGLTSLSFAFATPQQGDFIYDIYDVVVNKMVKGPVGAAAGIGLMVLGGVNLAMARWGSAVFPILGGALLYKADSIASTLGMTVNNF